MKTALAILAAALLPGIGRADTVVSAETAYGQFGTLDVNTGNFTALGRNVGGPLYQVFPLSLGIANGTLYAMEYGFNNFYRVNPANGALTLIANATSNILQAFGSTADGLYAITGTTPLILNSVNPNTGALTPIGPIGANLAQPLSYANTDFGLSESNVLYATAGEDLYTVDPTTGAATLVGPMGNFVDPQDTNGVMGSLLFENGTLYGSYFDFIGGYRDTLYTINTNTGLATPLSSVTVTIVSGGFRTEDVLYALAPDPIPPAAVPEPRAIWLLLSACGVAGIRLTGRGVRALRRG